MKKVRYYAVTYNDIGTPLDLGPLRTTAKAASVDGSRMTNDRRVASVAVVKRDFGSISRPRRNPEQVATAVVAQAVPAATVKNPYTRKTEDEYEIQGYYGRQTGWECLTTEISRRDAREQLRCYNEHDRGVAHRIVKKRVRK